MKLSLLLTLALTCVVHVVTTQSSKATTIYNAESDVRNSVVRLLKNPDINKNLDEWVRISFFVTPDQKLVVLKTDARSKELDKFIKARMNYHKIDAENKDTNRIYHLKVHFEVNEDQS